MKRSWNPREGSPPSVSKMANKGENGRSRQESSSTRSIVSSYRRSRSPRPQRRRKSSTPFRKRGTGLHDKRTRARSRRTHKMRPLPKRSRLSVRSRSPSVHSVRSSKEKIPSYSCSSTKDSILERSSPSPRSERYRSGDKFMVDSDSFRGPEKDVLVDRDNLKKIVVNMKGPPAGNDSIKREIVNPEDIVVVRRAGEGSRPIFDRDEIKNCGRKYEDDDKRPRRFFSPSPQPLGRRFPSPERFRSRDLYYDSDRISRHRELPGPRLREYTPLPYERYREESRPRFVRRSRSRERNRDFIPERRERFDDREYRRPGIRGRSSGRPFRRHPSPIGIRRINGRRMRSKEGEHELLPRDNESPPNDDFSMSDYPGESHGYYEGEPIEGKMPPASRGGGHSVPFRGRGSGGPMMRGGEIMLQRGPPVRPIRAVFLPRGPGMGRRLPFPPRLIRPIVRPVIRVIAPVIPVRSPSVLPVRHPVIPLPFQCEAFR